MGIPLKITIGALQDMTFDAALEYISPKATETNGANQFEIKAAVKLSATTPDGSPSGKDKIRSGYSANGYSSHTCYGSGTVLDDRESW